MKLYTKTGDKGSTGLAGGGRVSKSNIIIKTVGHLDMLNCSIGYALTHEIHETSSALLRRIQSALFDAGAEVSSKGKISSTYSDLIADMESAIDIMSEKMPAMKNFILPGGCPSAALLHIARGTCRTAECVLVDYYWEFQEEELEISPELLMFINRLSDFLFAAARFENFSRRIDDIIWVKSQPSV